jgi:hypothetical protein
MTFSDQTMEDSERQRAEHAIEALVEVIDVKVNPDAQFWGHERHLKSGQSKKYFEALMEDYTQLKTAIIQRGEVAEVRQFKVIDRGNGIGTLGWSFGRPGEFSALHTQRVKDLIAAQLRDLAAHETGRSLVIAAAQLAWHDDESKRFRIRIVNAGENSDASDSPWVQLNIWSAIVFYSRLKSVTQTHGTFDTVHLFSVHPLIHGIVDPDEFGHEELLESRNGLSPFPLTIAHEFIHRLDRHVPLPITMPRYHTLDEGYGRFRPIFKSNGDISEHTYYEHRAILDGSPTRFSELNLRLERNELLRFAYQESELHLYEPVESMLKLAVALAEPHDAQGIQDRIRGHLGRLPRVHVRKVDTVHTKIRLTLHPVIAQAFREERSGFMVDYVRRILDPDSITNINLTVTEGTPARRAAKLAVMQTRLKLMAYLDSNNEIRPAASNITRYLNELYHRLFCGLVGLADAKPLFRAAEQPTKKLNPRPSQDPATGRRSPEPGRIQGDL